jgi:hypothetical protein
MKKRPQKLLDRLREAIWLERYSIHTEDTYVAWTKCHRQKQLANALDICPRRSYKRALNFLMHDR